MTLTHRWKLMVQSFSVTAAILVTGSFGLAQQGVDSAVKAGGTRSVRGRVVGDGGKPVAGARVRAAFIQSAGSFVSDVEAISDIEGAFEMREFPAGVATLRIVAPSLVVVDGIPGNGVRAGDVLTIRMARGASIAGRVVDEEGKPLTGLHVTPELVLDERGVQPASGDVPYSGGLVDDRGEYRLFGLVAGNYVVSAGPPKWDSDRPEYLSDRSPTYYPSADRSSAAKITASLGGEVGKIDITFRGNAGHRVSGSIRGSVTPNSGWTRVDLYRPGNSEPARIAAVRSLSGDLQFFLDGVEDGDYELQGRASGSGGDQVVSDRLPVRVRDADVAGLTLTMVETGRIPGRVEFAADTKDLACKERDTEASRRTGGVTDMVVGYRGVAPKLQMPNWTGIGAEGRFVVSSLSGARYRLWMEFADEDVFLVRCDTESSPTSPARAGSADPTGTPAQPNVSSPVARDGVSVVQGKSADGVRFVVAHGAARVRGRIAPAKPGEPLPSRARVCLVPADPKQKDDVVHYYEVEVERDGTFEVRNVAPGEYFVVTRTFSGDDRPDLEILPAAWDAAERAALRSAAEKLGIRLTLSPCQRLESAVITMAQR